MLMFGICLLHAVGFGGHGQAWVVNILSSCVVGFVFISGWFGVRFSWWKVVKLYGIGVYAAAVLAVGLWATGTEPGAAAACGKAFNQLIHGFWFLHAYALMLCLSPLVNAACAPSFANSQNRTIEQSNNRTIQQSHPYPTIQQSNNPTIPHLLPLLFLVWIWGFGLTLPWFETHLPKTNGLDAYGGLTLTAIYAAARICRAWRLDERLRTAWLLVALPPLLFLTGIGLGDYNSPFAFALAGVCFLLVARLKLPAVLGKVVVSLAPSMFAVYLLHTNELGLAAFKPLEAKLLSWGLPIPCTWLAAALVVFITACAADLPRRAFAWLLRQRLSAVASSATTH